MLPCLGHDPLVSRYHQHDQVHTANPGYHCPDKSLMARYVHYAELDVAGKLKMSEAELDSDAPLLLFLQAIGVDPGKSLDQ
jgi:hypothetical protein